MLLSAIAIFDNLCISCRLIVLIPILIPEKNSVMKEVYLNLFIQIFLNVLFYYLLIYCKSLINTHRKWYHDILFFSHYILLKIKIKLKDLKTVTIT